MLNRNYGPAGYDRTQAFTAAFNYELPVGKGKKVAIENTVSSSRLTAIQRSTCAPGTSTVA